MKSALVIGGAGTVGSGVAESLRDAGWEVCTVDPAGGDLAESATADLRGPVGPRDLAVVCLPARGQARSAGEFRPAEVAANELPGRLAALELAISVLDGGTLIELTGGAALETSADEAGLIGRWQRQVRSGLDGVAGNTVTLCCINCYVPPERAAEIGRSILVLADENRGGVCRIGALGQPAEWID